MSLKITDFNKEVLYFTFEGGKDFEYTNLEDLFKKYGEDKIYTVKALYVNESKFGKQPLAVTDFINVNLPNHLAETVEQLRQIKEIVDDINDDKVGFKIYEYVEKKYNKTCYSIEWVEING